MKITIPHAWAVAAGLSVRRPRRRVPLRVVRAWCERCRTDVDFAQTSSDVKLPGFPGDE